MKHFRIPVIFIIIAFGLITYGQAPENLSQIKGYVYNPENKPSEYSTIVLMNKDSVFMKGTLSGEDGSFLFDGLDEGSYFIMVRNVEFNTYISDPVILRGNDVREFEHIQLVTRVNDLEEVVIRGEKAMVEVHPDKMVYNVSGSVNATGNNALELLSKSPGVMVDMDKNITLQGKSGVQIYINGRPSRISGNDLTNMLEGMRSEDIESIEIISNPSAKYDAEGTGGIINIVLKKNLASGFNGNIIGSYSRGLHSRSSAGTSLNYSGHRINAFSSINLSGNDYMTDRNESMLREAFLLTMDSEEITDRKGLNFAGGVDYHINSEHTLSLDARVLINNRNSAITNNTFITDVAGVLDTELLVSGTNDDGSSENYNGNIHYSFVPNRSSSLTADVSFGTYSSSKYTGQPNWYYNEDGTDLLRSVESDYDANTDIRIFSAQADYEKKISRVTFSAGAKYSYISTGNGLTFYNVENGTPVLDTGRSNNFSYLEKIAAAYFIFNASPTNRISLNAGIRLENTSSLGELVSANPGPDDVVPRNYTTLFPNVSLSYNDEKNHALSLSIGRRITRPDYQNLNPFETKLSELAAWRGNPFLEPNFITNYQLSYSFRRKLVISDTYSVTRNFFAIIFEAVGDKGNVMIPRNMDKVTNNGLSVSYPQKVFKWWEFSAFLIYNYSTYGGDFEGTLIGLKAHIVNFRLQNNIKLPLGITMELSYFGTTPVIWRGTVHVDGFQRIDIGVKREFFNKKLMLQATGSDLFNTGSTYYYSSDYGGIIVDGDISFDQRRVGFSATYKFGNQQIKTRKKSRSAMDEELERISE